MLGHRAHRPRLVQLGQVGLDPGRPHHVQRPAPAALGRRLEQEGPAEAVVGVEVRDDDDLDVLAAGTRSAAGGAAPWARAPPAPMASMTKLFQYRPGGARKLPVPRKVSSVT